ncbi:hypothetical protein PPTG_00872 [Phytophthora nicotianae INRA-310]|uniref:Uncharacterized protein n=1 Tax=Phytophthora nicotianae (strain INRA-310) TaxID=761204 RepID=W2RHD4_PHYN3|nr:hypothetical protein PPTG_00872 [Phytophthora nicotianae INRA-310]ETN24641.1 hypothetical protein PPTG_00872 [Phytophthora nicotianae INRA-310]
MLSGNTDILSDAAFFEEAADFFDNCFPPSSSLFSSIEESESSAAADMLTILDPCDEVSNSSSPTNPPPSNTTADERDLAVIALNMHREKEKLRRRKQRQRIKDELDKLRRAHGELDDQLKMLKLAKEAKRNPSQHWSIWKELALVQRKERHRSETEKRRLTTTAKTQEIYIDNLHGLLQLQQNSATLESAWTSVIKDSTDHRLESADISMFASLLQKIESCRVKMDDILNGCGLLVMPTGVENSMHWCDESGELKYHQNLHKFTLPFDLETSQWSCWEPFKYRQRQCDREDYDGIEDSENTVALKFRVIRTMASGSTVSVVQWLVARRFIDHNRVSYIWKAYTEGERDFSWDAFEPNRMGFSSAAARRVWNVR